MGRGWKGTGLGSSGAGTPWGLLSGCCGCTGEVPAGPATAPATGRSNVPITATRENKFMINSICSCGVPLHMIKTCFPPKVPDPSGREGRWIFGRGVLAGVQMRVCVNWTQKIVH
jgi:hypothetical protein